MKKRASLYFLTTITIFIVALSSVFEASHQIYPFNYYQSSQFEHEMNLFSYAFYLINYELPELKTPLNDIEVSDSDIQQVRYNLKIGNYYTALVDWFNLQYEHVNEFDDTTISDDEIKAFIQYQKYAQYQARLANINEAYYRTVLNNFYYTITDSTDKTYTNLTETSKYKEAYLISEQQLFAYLSHTDAHYHYDEPFISSFYQEENTKSFSGSFYIPSDAGRDYIITQANAHTARVIRFFISLAVALISGIMALCMGKKLKANEFKLPKSLSVLQTQYVALPIEARVLSSMLASWFILNTNIGIYWPHLYQISDLFVWLWSIMIQVTLLLFLFGNLCGLVRRIKDPSLILNEWQNGFYQANIEAWRQYPIYRNVFVRVSLYSALIGLWGVTLLMFGPFWLMLSFFLMIVLLLVIKKKSQNVQQLNDMIDQMARGEMPTDLHLKRAGFLGEIGKDLNTIKAGVTLIEKKQSQSERLKTELITNVSHDLRTPLTSILNYVDLARRDDITEEERQNYLDILDRKAKRLNVLINDLFEASKMASGAVELQKQQVNLVALLQQSLGEYEERFTAAELTLKTQISGEQIMAMVDARKLFRVFENLLSNAVKYSQPYTRVYVEMKEDDDHVMVTVKNISNYELGFEISELSERFKRGDASRHTEGSGLGLAIVKSILDLHGATLELTQDADLFKVTMCLPKSLIN